MYVKVHKYDRKLHNYKNNGILFTSEELVGRFIKYNKWLMS